MSLRSFESPPCACVDLGWPIILRSAVIDREHIYLLKISISKNGMKQNDENLSELELKSFWYKLHKKNICTKMNLIISFSIINCF
jgi:hypothetical protein